LTELQSSSAGRKFTPTDIQTVLLGQHFDY